MMTQVGALFLDAYRELNAKKMFWIVLILNVLVIGAFAVVGVSDSGIRILWFNPLDIRGISAMYLYKSIFSTGIVGFWFSWLATLLALISTAGIFPDFLSSGSVDLYLSKPMSRLRLFFTKYLAGLLFVTLQITVFTVLCFFVLGIRGGLWQFGLFWAIPLVVLFFSYLFGICALLGTWTRSTVAALMLTLLAWFCIWAVDWGERQIGNVIDQPAMMAATLDDQIEALDASIARAETQPAVQTAPATSSAALVNGTMPAETLDELKAQRDALVTRRKEIPDVSSFESVRNVAFVIKSFVPKTRETMNLLDRVLFTDQDLKDAVKPADETTTAAPQPRGIFRGGPGRRMRERELAQVERERQRPVWWVIGTSLIFEGVCLALAAWHFCRRDF